MTAPPSMTVTATAAQILGNLVAGTDLSETALYNVPVTFVSNVAADQVVLWENRIEKLPPVVAHFAPDGTLKRNGDPVKLLANDSGLNVTGLQWTCFINGTEEFTFNAGVDGEVIDLSAVVHTPNVPVVALTTVPLTGIQGSSVIGRQILSAADQAAEWAILGNVPTGNLPAPPTWSTISGKPAVVAAGVDQAAARAAISTMSATEIATAIIPKEDLSNKSTTTTLGASDTLYPTQKAVKTYVDTAVSAATGVLKDKGVTDASANPNYPAAVKGDAYIVTVAGKIGGASGKSVDVGDLYFAHADNAGGTEASVGTSWVVLEHNLVGALLAGNNLSDIANAATARTNLGLGNVDNTSDLNKPVSVAQAAADALKANIASPTFTGTVGGITKSMVGLGNVDNTSDLNKPVSTAQQTALNLKEDLSNKSTTTTLGASDTLYPTQKAVKTYVDTAVTGVLKDRGVTDAGTNPNYPAAVKGDAYIVTVAGKIGGASGKSVDVGDLYFAHADNAGGTEASVGTSWAVLEHNLVGALLAANNLSDITNAATARTNLGLGNVTNDAQVKLSTVTTKGDMIVGTGSATVARLAAGANGQVDVDDSTTSTGRAKVYPRALSFNLPSIGGSTANSAAQNDTAFAAALAAMGNYGELHIPPGTYDFNGFAYPNVGSVTVRGSGRNKTFLRNNHATNPSVKFDGTGATGANIYGPGCELTDLALTATALRTAQVGIDSRLAVAFSIERLHIESIGIAAQIQTSWAGAYRDIDVLTCDVGLILGSTPANTPLVIDNFNVYNCRRGGWIKGTAGDAIKFINGGFTNSTENGMVIDSFSRNISFDTVIFENNTSDDVIIGNVTPSEGPILVVFDGCAFLADALHKTRSVHYIKGSSVAFYSCAWQGFSGGHYDVLIEQDGTSSQLVIDNPSYDASNQVLLHKWDGNHQLPQGGTRLDSHGFIAGGVSRFGNGVSRIPSVAAVTASATPAVNTDLADHFNIPVTAAITSMTTGLTGTAYDGQEATCRFKDNGTARAIAWGTKFTGTLLTTTIANKTHTQKLVYDAAVAKWAGVYADAAGY